MPISSIPSTPATQPAVSGQVAATESAKLDWQAEALWQQLSPLLPGVSIEVLARSDSTNTALLERVRSAVRAAAEGQGGRAGDGRAAHARTADGRPTFGRRAEDLQPCLLVAEHQTQGRGRMGRTWLASPGSSLTFSLGLCLDMQDWSGLSLAVGCAIAEALEPSASLGAAAQPRLRLKWPNDLWLDGRKLGGILIETVAAGAQRMVVVGVGLNISALPTPAEAGVSITSPFSSGFAALNELQPELTAPTVLALIVPALAQALLNFPYSGFAAWQPAFERRDLTLGRAVTAGVLDGIARGVNAQGELLVQTPQGLHSLSGGEVSLRLQLATPAA
jgi:BirA family biotin operon repressor/biotin-[acetyl-CoA-carboxylase] ligase